MQIKLCNIDGCGKKYWAKGYCRPHYRRFKKNGDPIAVIRQTGIGCLVEGCDKEYSAKGYCVMHYDKNRRNGNPLFVKHEPKDIFEAFSKHIKPNNSGCWLWSGAKRHGYGAFTYRYKSYSAHRMSYMYFKGPIENGLHIMHSCDNRACINPEHLSVGTRLDNMKDMTNKKRQAHGERNGHSKLIESQVLEIREKLKNNIKHIVLSEEYNVSIRTISDIKTRRSWRIV